MTDRRLTPDPDKSTRADPAQIAVSVADLRRSPDGPRDRQLIYGDMVTVLGDDGDWRYVQSAKDGYCGYVQRQTLGPRQEASHQVCTPATHAFERADFKSPDLISLSFGSRVAVTGGEGNFAQTSLGFIPLNHLAPLETLYSDPAEIAARFLGTPYLWGGNSRWGIDCSGLVQAALLACGMPCPADSDQQQTLGHATNEAYQRNDLLFWKGHVAIVSDPQTILHASAGAMSTVYEPIDDAIKRIEAQGDGPVTGHRRL
ncbi:C40 family peptidase [Sulfitobacter mediterraneus]|uniref:Cell wall-associated NlpC family hydrolase n=1 Tax=Sulfitobacter mediterraneus TaxID=83219 RepID=A0A2T6CEP7_9RHOB|nr:NlpC/P60 family protein [Sulfitobacter mediterraneus]KIN76318.1 NlpC/P60 domain protein [Sulfitobacter mediterraneus KCTC 32188]PTX73983.1 cell wall-associated NlpC family hydrolase [Sulfitobacter mediterraneus]